MLVIVWRGFGQRKVKIQSEDGLEDRICQANYFYLKFHETPIEVFDAVREKFKELPDFSGRVGEAEIEDSLPTFKIWVKNENKIAFLIERINSVLRQFKLDFSFGKAPESKDNLDLYNVTPTPSIEFSEEETQAFSQPLINYSRNFPDTAMVDMAVVQGKETKVVQSTALEEDDEEVPGTPQDRCASPEEVPGTPQNEEMLAAAEVKVPPSSLALTHNVRYFGLGSSVAQQSGSVPISAGTDNAHMGSGTKIVK